MASPSYTYTLANSTTADASQVMQDFNDILNGVTDGTKDLSISALTCAGTATLNGHVNLGNSSSDDLSITASLASSLAIKTNNTYDIGSATLGLRKLYLGNAGAGATCDIVAASHATTREYTIPDCSAAASFVMTQGTQTISGTKTFDGQLIGKGVASDGTASAGYIGESVETNDNQSRTMAGSTEDTWYTASASINLTAGDWLLYLMVTSSVTLSAIGQGVIHQAGIKTTSTAETANTNMIQTWSYVCEDLWTSGDQFIQHTVVVPYRVANGATPTVYAAIKWIRLPSSSAPTVTSFKMRGDLAPTFLMARRVR